MQGRGVPGHLAPGAEADVARKLPSLGHERVRDELHAVLPVVPLWLDEGLAEYFEIPPGERAFDCPHLQSARWGVRMGIVPSLDKMERLRDLSEMGEGEYRAAWAWTHFILHGCRPAHDELIRFLADIHAHALPGSFVGRLRQRIPDLEEQFASHFRAWKP